MPDDELEKYAAKPSAGGDDDLEKYAAKGTATAAPSEQQRQGVTTPSGIAPMKPQTETNFEKKHEGDRGILGTLGDAAKSAWQGITAGPTNGNFDPTTSEFWLGKGPTFQTPPMIHQAMRDIPSDLPGQGNALGRGIYRAASIASPLVPGLDPEAMEQSSAQGHTGEVIGETALPLGMLAAGEAVKAAPDVLGGARGSLRESAFKEYPTTGSPQLNPGARRVARAVGTGAGAGIGSLTGIPGAGYAGGVAGFELGPSLMERTLGMPELGSTRNPGPFSKLPARVKVAPKESIAAPRTSFGNAGDVPYGEVLKVPEPNENLPPVNPKYMASVPRAELLGMAENRTPGAAAQLGELGNRPLYLPETGYAAPRSITNLSETIEGNPTPFGGGITQELKPQVHTLSEKAETLSGPRKSLGAEWEAGERSHEIERNKSILRDSRATEEDKRIAQQRLNEVQDVFGEGNR